MGKIVAWRYEGVATNDHDERLVIECEPTAKTHADHAGIEINVTVGNKTVWLSDDQARELNYALSAMFTAQAHV